MNLKNHFPKKKFGQHWLINQGVLNQIRDAANLNNSDSILEIGPGRGALTSKLLDSNIKALHAIELDKDLIEYLKNRFSKDKRFTLEQSDILTSDIRLLNENYTKVIANIPYNITGPILNMFVGKLGQSRENKFNRIIFLMQKDIVDRIIAQEGASNRGALSTRIQLISKVEKICDVGASSFDPPPKVDSSVIAFEPLDLELRNNREVEINIDKLLKISFNSRRKKLRNTLKQMFTGKEFENLLSISDINFNLRPQDISLKQWITIAEFCIKIKY